MKILDNSGQEYQIVDYINTPPSEEELKSLAKKMGISAKDFIRSNESIFKDLGLKPFLDNDAILYKHMSKNPKLISMESEKKYFDMQNKNFPFEKYNFVKTIYSQRKLYKYSFLTGWGYEEIPSHEFDLIYIDGPNAADNEIIDENEPSRFCFDLINVILKTLNKLLKQKKNKLI